MWGNVQMWDHIYKCDVTYLNVGVDINVESHI